MSIPWTILMISLFCLGLREVTDDIDGGRIGYPLRKWFVDNTPEYIMKPIIVCCACMASFWGTVIYWLVLIHYAGDLLHEICKWETYGLWIFCCLAASYINTILWVLRNKMIGL
jgi:hypothetical protein